MENRLAHKHFLPLLLRDHRQNGFHFFITTVSFQGTVSSEDNDFDPKCGGSLYGDESECKKV